MITAGIDAGMETTKAVILKENGESDWVISRRGNESTIEAAQSVLDEVARKGKISVKDIDYIVATGMGREYITFASRELQEFICLAKGIDSLLPSTRILIDLGARKSLAMRCNGGRVLKTAMSGKCAAGTGAYLEMVSNVLSVNIHDIDKLFFESKEDLEILSNCVVFAESEIISLVHSGVKTEDIVRGVFRGLAGRAYSQFLELGIEKDITLVGGVANSKAMITALEEKLGFDILVPENPGIIAALGAAIIAQEARSVT
ncbi:acyl-CoA dehydratase activase [Chloroflexota bacterium]